MPSTYGASNFSTNVMADSTVPTGTTLDPTFGKKNLDSPGASPESPGSVATANILTSTTDAVVLDSAQLGSNVGGYSGSLTYTAGIHISSGIISSLNTSFALARYNSSGVLQGSISAASAEQATTVAGQYTFTLTVDLGAFATTDRLRIYYLLRNASTMTNMSPSLTINTSTDTYVVVPWPAPSVDVYYVPQAISFY